MLYELILTDGWYSIKTTIDPLLTLMINKKKIFTGLKLLIHSAELTNCPKGCDILEVSLLITLIRKMRPFVLAISQTKKILNQLSSHIPSILKIL